MSTTFSPERSSSPLYRNQPQDYVYQQDDVDQKYQDLQYQPITTSKCRDRLQVIKLGFYALGIAIYAFAMGIFVAIGKLFCQFRKEDLAGIFKVSAKLVALSGYSFFTACFLEKGMQNQEYKAMVRDSYFG